MSASFDFDAFRGYNHSGVRSAVGNAWKYEWGTPNTDPLGNPTGTANRRNVKPPSLEGTKYSRYGARGEGIGSALDAALVERHIKKERDNMGDGFIQMKVINGDPTKPLNIGNRMFYPQADGTYTIIDGKAIDVLYQREKEKREYIESLIERAMTSNEICALLLGMSETELDMVLGKASKYGLSQQGPITDPDLLEVDARPESIETYAEDSIVYSRSIQKFKLVFKTKMPIVDNFTTDKVLNEE